MVLEVGRLPSVGAVDKSLISFKVFLHLAQLPSLRQVPVGETVVQVGDLELEDHRQELG